jgi:arginyl-tRNA synthetase
MSENKIPTIFVKLNDRCSIFYDSVYGTSITGDDVLETLPTEKIKTALRGGALVKLSEDEVKEYKEKLEKSATESVKESATDTSKLSYQEIKDKLKELGVKFENNASKEDLLAFLKEAQAKVKK